MTQVNTLLPLTSCEGNLYDDTENSVHQEAQRCYTLTQKLSRKKSIPQIVQIFKITDKILKNFKMIFRKMEVKSAK